MRRVLLVAVLLSAVPLWGDIDTKDGSAIDNASTLDGVTGVNTDGQTVVSGVAALVVSSASGGVTTAQASPNSIVLPATIASGDLLLAIVGFQDTAGTVTWDNTTAGTWTGDLSDVPPHLTVWAKLADGTEDGATLSVSTSSITKVAYEVFAIQNWSGTIATDLVMEATVLSGVSNQLCDPPTATDSFGTVNRMTIAACFISTQGNTLDAYPTGYADNQVTRLSAGAGADNVLFLATRSASEGSQDPPIFDLGSNSFWRSGTFSVK